MGRRGKATQAVSTTIHHCCVDLGAIIRRRDRDLIGLIRHNASKRGVDLSEPEVYARAAILQAMGYEAWPLCDNFDKTGHCKGHPSE